MSQLSGTSLNQLIEAVRAGHLPDNFTMSQVMELDDIYFEYSTPVSRAVTEMWTNMKVDWFRRLCNARASTFLIDEASQT